jgi:hypothetical protein
MINLRSSHNGCLVALTLLSASFASAQTGIAAPGSTGGLVIPSANTLQWGDIALSAGSYEEPGVGLSPKRRNFTMGVGIWPNIELFGRFAEYQDPLPGSTFVNGGPRDLSANLKVRLPMWWKGQPRLAVGVNDVSGGASFFKSIYAVASDDFGPVEWTLGFAKGSPRNGAPLDGIFGGVQYKFGDTGLSLLAEHDGQQKHIGVRYQSQGFASLAGSRFLVTAQRSLGARDPAGKDIDSSSVGLGVIVPLGQFETRRAEVRVEKPLPAIDTKPSSAIQPTAADRLDALTKALVGAGFERVRVGMLGATLMVEYENHRYGQSEADAMGIVLGLAAELAPANTRRVSAVTLKAGLRVYESSVDVGTFRRYLRDGDAAPSRADLSIDRAPSYEQKEVKWAQAAPGRHAPIRVEVRPDIGYHLGTEVAAFDYSLAVAFQAAMPVWQGGEVVATYIQHLANSKFYEPGLAWGDEKQRTGLKALTLQQTFWIGQHVFGNVGVGKYDYDNFGIQGDATVFVPGSSDVVRLRAAVYDKNPTKTNPQRIQAGASYRWVPQASTWLEAGIHQYGDGTRGPSLVLTRWFGDVGVHMHYSRGGTRQYAGLDLTIPLTPRRGAELGPVAFNGEGQFRRGIRTRILNATNTVAIDAARDIQLEYSSETNQLNGGRISQKYFVSQLPRMREAFYLYGREQLPN